MVLKNAIKPLLMSGVLAMGLASALVPAGAARADTIDVTLVAGHPPVFLWVRHLTETFIPTVDKALAGTGHTIRWSEQYGGALAKVGGELEALEEGVADAGVVVTTFEAAKLPLQNITYYTPFSTADAGQVLAVMDRLHATVPGLVESWRAYDVEYLGGGFALDDYQLFTTFPVASLADLKGRKIGTPGAAINWLKETGAVGVMADLTSYYNSIKTGVFEGCISFGTAALTARLHEVAPHVTRVSFGAQFAGAVVANRPFLDRLPDPVKAAFRAGARAYTKAYLADMNTRIDTAYKAMADQGAKITPLPAGERADWARRLPGIARTWAADTDARGLPASPVLTAYLNALRSAGAQPLRAWDQD